MRGSATLGVSKTPVRDAKWRGKGRELGPALAPCHQITPRHWLQWDNPPITANSTSAVSQKCNAFMKGNGLARAIVPEDTILASRFRVSHLRPARCITSCAANRGILRGPLQRAGGDGWARCPWAGRRCRLRPSAPRALASSQGCDTTGAPTRWGKTGSAESQRLIRNGHSGCYFGLWNGTCFLSPGF